MYSLLYEYLLLHGKLILPGTGLFRINRQPSRSDFANRLLYPPVHTLEFLSTAENPPLSFYNWLGNRLGISPKDAVFRFNDFMAALQSKMAAGSAIEWNGLGTLQKGMGDSAPRFSSSFTGTTADEAITAEKIIRDKAEHTVKVGEDEKTSAEMTELLSKPGTRTAAWVWIAGAVGVLALGFLVWHFIQQGFGVNAFSNQCLTHPANATGLQ